MVSAYNTRLLNEATLSVGAKVRMRREVDRLYDWHVQQVRTAVRFKRQQMDIPTWSPMLSIPSMTSVHRKLSD